MVNGEELVTERLEELREKIYKVEKELAKYGFDPRRGIESYRVSELRTLLAKSHDREKTKALLVELINLQEQLYLELYKLAGLKRMNVDTDTPEKRLMTIKEWLLTGKVNSTRLQKNKFKEALKAIADTLEKCDENCAARIEEILRLVYKRDYDRYRVAKRVLELCVSYSGASRDALKDLESLPITVLAERVVECARRIGGERLSEIIRLRGGIY